MDNYVSVNEMQIFYFHEQKSYANVSLSSLGVMRISGLNLATDLGLNRVTTVGLQMSERLRFSDHFNNGIGLKV